MPWSELRKKHFMHNITIRDKQLQFIKKNYHVTLMLHFATIFYFNITSCLKLFSGLEMV